MNLPEEDTIIQTNDIVAIKKETIRKNKNLIDSVRRCHTDDKNLIAKMSNVSWPTINNFLSTNSNLENGYSNLIVYSDEKFEVNPNYGLFLGIAVGARETKVSFVTMAFDALSDELIAKYELQDLYNKLYSIDRLVVKVSEEPSYICYETKNDLFYISHMCNEIITEVLDFFSNSNGLNLLGVGITFPGIIDKHDLKVCFCPNISCLNGVHLLDVLYDSTLDILSKRSISLCIAHDTLAITVYEKENLYKSHDLYKFRNKDNVVCLYLGMGVGLGTIINNQLLRGNTNSIGEIGHIPSISIEALKPNEDTHNKEYFDDYYRYKISEESHFDKTTITSDSADKCHCAIDNCIEKMIRVNVFNSANIDDYIDKTTSKHLKEFDKEHPYRYSVLKHYLQYLFNIIINLFNPDLLILSGKILNSISALRADKHTLKQSSAIYFPAYNCDIINGSDRIDCVAIGAAILAYYKLAESNGTNDADGMEFNVGWDKKI